MKLFLASGNAHKAQEMNALSGLYADSEGVRFEIISAKEVGGMPSVEEDTGTFIGNARKKAVALKAKLPRTSWVLSDDSGICVDALGGAPGVESAYFAGPQGDSAANLRKLVETMRTVPTSQRGADFVCVLFVLDAENREYVFQARTRGRLLQEPVGGAGFGYDPLFVPDGFAKTYAQLTEEEKNQISHRAKAWKSLQAGLAKPR